MKLSTQHRLDVYAYLKKHRRWVSTSELSKAFDPEHIHDIKRRAREVASRHQIDYPEKIDKKRIKGEEFSMIYYKLAR